MVRVRAPFLANHASDEDEDTPRAGAVGRYCRDHAGLVCAADGFYWRDGRGKAGVWIDFKGEWAKFRKVRRSSDFQTISRPTSDNRPKPSSV